MARALQTGTYEAEYRVLKPDMSVLWITERGSCVDCRVEDIDLAGNVDDGMRLDTPPVGGRWRDNHVDSDWS